MVPTCQIGLFERTMISSLHYCSCYALTRRYMIVWSVVIRKQVCIGQLLSLMVRIIP